jgi:hypothetical protein
MVEEDGVYYECQAGCCHEGKGCPGQCDGVDPSPPYRVISPSDVYQLKLSENITSAQLRDAALVGIIGLCIVNALLFLASILKLKK